MKNPKAYTASHDAYIGGKYYKAGEPFVTADDKEDTWTLQSPEEAHTIESSLNKIPADAPLDDMDVTSLKAVAVTHNINVTGMSKKQLIDAIKAANEPAL